MAVVAVLAALVLTVAPASAGGDEPRETVDETADTVDGTVNAAECEAWSHAWPGPGDCIFGPDAEFRCALWGETSSAQPGSGGLGYTLAGEVECREAGRTLRVLRGTFETGPGLVTRTCQFNRCDRRGVPYDVYATAGHGPRCVYDFTGSGGPQPDSDTLNERSSEPASSDDPRLALSVELPGHTAIFRADDFSVTNGDGVGVSSRIPRPTASFWVLDDGEPENGWSEGVAEVRVTMHEHRVDPASGEAPSNCLPTDELSGFTVEGKLDFEINEESLFRPPPGYDQ